MVIGAGPNGLVAANLLADAGWDVLVLEAFDRPGGAVATDDDVAPGFRHDTFSSFYPLGAASPVIRGLDLEQHGLVWSHAPAVIGSPGPDGGWALVHRDAERTIAGLEASCPGDGDGWRALYGRWLRIGGSLVDALLSPFPPIRAGMRLGGAMLRGGLADDVQFLLRPATAMTAQHLRSEAAKLLVVGNAAHADLPPDGAGSGLFGWLLAMIGQQRGFPVPRGGAGSLTDALVRRLVAAGGRVRCGAEVEEILVADGRAVGVRTAAGRLRTRRAVIADVGAPALYERLLPAAAVPHRIRQRMQGFTWDPGTVKVDWALDRPVPWADTPETAPGTVHLPGGSGTAGDVSVWMSEVQSGIVPADPFLLIGQMTTSDPTRSPAGTESLWAYTHVPQHTVRDAGTGISGRWDRDDLERMADRMQGRLERAAPGFGARVIARRVLGPREFEARNANLHGGALGGGTANLHQELVLRPIPGRGRAETHLGGLYLGSSAAHPGGGVHGAPGANAARAALWHARFRP
ncbi:NAD(P)-binding protein [Nakamurella sp. YIM 132087]|uniref:Pyridine nucleotide-disulfide oxidoreductase domain-containing protein 2 n=1 Tax=Nakamurella alba TaxID=2665158 RepID=A0A7K1FP12_9ACTN|nr:NAD(P)-binding protein [Nakamurella alba]